MITILQSFNNNKCCLEAGAHFFCLDFIGSTNLFFCWSIFSSFSRHKQVRGYSQPTRRAAILGGLPSLCHPLIPSSQSLGLQHALPMPDNPEWVKAIKKTVVMGTNHPAIYLRLQSKFNIFISKPFSCKPNLNSPDQATLEL